MFSRIGLFHFVEGYEKPFEELETALDAALIQYDNISGSLIVLPEGFNRGRPYTERGKPKFHKDVALEQLTKISERLGTIFVAGLIGPAPHSKAESHESWSGRNSAFWIDGRDRRLIYHKESDDGTKNYAPCLSQAYDHVELIEHEDTSAGVLICMDINSPGVRDHLMARFAQCGSTTKILCIPAVMSKDRFGGDSLTGTEWAGKHVILANATRGCPSFIANPKGRKMVQCPEHSNKIALRTWAELDPCSI